MKCKHCGDDIKAWTCDKSEKPHAVLDQCRACHNELRHDIIKNQNIHICGGGPDPGHSDGSFENVVREMEGGRDP